jgi:ABC-type uncharacterized transport system permease subunit
MKGRRGDLNERQVALFLGIGTAAFFIAARVWRAGVRHYSGSSS